MLGALGLCSLQLAAQDPGPSALIPGQNWVSPELSRTDSTIYTYAEIIGARTGLTSIQLSVRIDSGQYVQVERGRGRPVDGSDFYPYTSMSGALNALTRRGYRLVNMQSIVTGDSYWGMVWVVRRPMEPVELVERE